MKNLFEHTSAPWVKYSSYEYRTADDGTLYIVVSENAKPQMYRPMQDANTLVLDAVNIGLMAMHKARVKRRLYAFKLILKGFARCGRIYGYHAAVAFHIHYVVKEYSTDNTALC